MQIELFEDGRIRMSWLDIPAAAAELNIIGLGAEGNAQANVDLGQSEACQDDTVPGEPCMGDLDGSGRVDIVDLLNLLESWGQCD
jgi:hypothetical protein